MELIDDSNKKSLAQLEALYPVNPSLEWGRSTDHLKSGLLQTMHALLSLNEMDQEVLHKAGARRRLLRRVFAAWLDVHAN